MLEVTLYIILVIGALFIADALVGFVQIARGHDEEKIGRRIFGGTTTAAANSRIEILRHTEGGAWYSYLPFQRPLINLILRGGNKTNLGRVWINIAIWTGILFLILLLIVPTYLILFSVILSFVVSLTINVLFLRRAASNRITKFTEQLPDALDLMVRSLRVGHPVNGAMSVIAREMEEPIGSEFAIACEQITYGHDVANSFLEMNKRVPAQDLGYLTVVIQVQQESGGNLVESLSKLSAVMRDRFRMFRKVKALTVEGRVSAWILSIFPLFIALALWLVKPDYFDQVMEYRFFPIILIVLIALLIINVMAMRAITNIKV